MQHQVNHNQPIRNIIFDVDGTMLDSKRDIAAAQCYVLKQFGIDSITPEDIYGHIGKPLHETFSRLLPPELHHRIPEAGIIYREYYRPRALNTTTLFPGVSDTLAQLSERGFQLAVATTKSTETTARILKHFGVEHYFMQLQGTSPEEPYKPDPYVINKILNQQHWSALETLMVGDTDADILAGKAAGVRTCGVTYGSLNQPQIESLQPDFIICRFSDILSIDGIARKP